MRTKRYMVGELQGENQFPPESVRKGRICLLIFGNLESFDNIDPLYERYDESIGALVAYKDGASGNLP